MKRAIGAVILVLVLSVGGYAWHAHAAASTATYKTPEEANVYVRFEMEAFDIMEAHYWKKATDADYAQLFYLALQKAGGTLPKTAPTDRASTAKMFAAAFAATTSDVTNRALALQILQVAVYNLPPAGRDELLSSSGVANLRNQVKNIDPGNNLYQDLGVASSAPQSVIEDAYSNAAQNLAHATSSQAKEQLQKITYAKSVLTDASARQIYDSTNAEPTLYSKLFGSTLYINMTKFSPTTPQELANAIVTASSSKPDGLILDLRGNLGGSLDFAPFLLGLFIGKDQYAFDLYHQGEKDVQRTTGPKVEELSQFKDIAVLTDDMTQSTAEVLTSAFERFHLATVVGTTTRGWGTVENTFPLTTQIDPDTQYALLLVHSLTLRNDDQPIEGNGVTPDIQTSDRNWKTELRAAFRTNSMITTLETVLSEPPLHW